MSNNTPEPDEFGRYRVLDLDTGHKRSIAVSQLPHGNHKIVDEPASDVAGDPYPVEYGAGPVAGGSDPYKGWKVDRLKGEIEARNDARGDDEPLIVVEEPGNKPELLAALRADDALKPLSSSTHSGQSADTLKEKTHG